MDTTFEHLGNVIASATDKEIKIFLNQCMKKMQLDKEQMLKYFSNVMDCESFYYDGSMIELGGEK